MSFLHSNPIEIDIPGRNPSRKVSDAPDRALSACFTAKTLKQLSVISCQSSETED
jgi:hypothetical protein